MAYPTATHTRVLHFSNPNVSYQGSPTGVPIGQPGEVYNVRVLNDNDEACEDFELTRYDIYVDFSYGGPELGTYVFPYDTLTEGITNIDTPNTGAAETPNLYVQSGTTGWSGTITKAMLIHACGGAVTIGQ